MPTELYENLEAPKKAVLAAVDTGEYDVETSLEELRELARTAGYPVVGTATQKLQSPVAATFMGSGRLLELKEYLEAVEADLIIFDYVVLQVNERLRLIDGVFHGFECLRRIGQ